ncbi:hypothetical protein BTVI_25078 [Pitangus sulphuratus]|nr:hypothetical protein BTVI_25078 [Pitangus sulphuratus]
MPASSRANFLPLTKAKPIRSNSNASVIPYLRTEGCCPVKNSSQGKEEREYVNNNADTKIHKAEKPYFHLMACMTNKIFHSMDFSLSIVEDKNGLQLLSRGYGKHVKLTFQFYVLYYGHSFVF